MNESPFKKASQMVLMDSQVWEPLIKKPSSQQPAEGGIQNHTEEKETDDLQTGRSWIYGEKKSIRIKLRTQAQTNELTQEVFRFPFFFDEYDSYDGAGCKERTAEEEN